MKVIVVSGGRSKVGKTQLSRALSELLPGAVRVKIGHHSQKPNGDENFYAMGTAFSTIAVEHKNAAYLIIESNRILEEITPDCTIYLPAENPKPSAEVALKKADIIRGEPVPVAKLSAIAGRLGCDAAIVQKIAELSGALKG